VHDHVRLRHLLERRSERLDEVVRQLGDEADGVRQRRRATTGQDDPPRGRVERREQLVGDDDLGAGQPTHQRRLSRVRVARDRDLRHVRPLPAGPLRVAGGLHRLDVAAELRDAASDVLPVRLELRLARPARADAAPQPAHRLAPAAQARQQIVELRELHLRLALARVRVQREDVEDQRGAVEDLHAEPSLDRAQGAGRELLVEDDELGAPTMHDVVQLLHLPLADPELRVGLGAALHHPADRLGPGRIGERRELVEVRLLDSGAHAHEDRALVLHRPPRRRDRRLDDAGVRRSGHAVSRATIPRRAAVRSTRPCRRSRRSARR
jgi:hypothetical protein